MALLGSAHAYAFLHNPPPFRPSGFEARRKGRPLKRPGSRPVESRMVGRDDGMPPETAGTVRAALGVMAEVRVLAAGVGGGGGRGGRAGGAAAGPATTFSTGRSHASRLERRFARRRLVISPPPSATLGLRATTRMTETSCPCPSTSARNRPVSASFPAPFCAVKWAPLTRTSSHRV